MPLSPNEGQFPARPGMGTEGRSTRKRGMESKNGNEHELGEVLEGMRPRLEHLVAVKMDPRLRRRIDPGDVTQAAFVDVVRRFDEWARLHARMPLFCWVRLMTLQKLAEFHRRHIGTLKRDVRREVYGSDSGSNATLARTIIDQHESPSKEIMRLEREDVLHLTLQRMKPMDREILTMRHFERLSNEECAHVLGLTRAGAKVRHMRATRRLRYMLERADLLEGLTWTSTGRARPNGE